jgi:pimeloyl-ACP methyl ester carboxylesterase
MYLTVLGNPTYCYTGGKAFDAAKPTVVFIHGVLNDHSVWILQTRYLAHHGFNVLAVDLPGHAKSAGVNRDSPPCLSVETAADFIIELLDAADIKTAALVGHSFGSLIAIETAARDSVKNPSRIKHLALLGTAAPMAVSSVLLDTSISAPNKAIDMVNTFSHSMLAPPPSSLGPGTWLYGGSRALMRRVHASNTAFNLFHTGFAACNSYKSAVDGVSIAYAAILFIVGKADQMTPPKAAKPLIDAAIASGKSPQVVTLDAGHSLMTEAPDGVLMALKDFLAPLLLSSQAISA